MTSFNLRFHRTTIVSIGAIVFLLLLHTVIVLQPSNSYRNPNDLLALKSSTTTRPLFWADEDNQTTIADSCGVKTSPPEVHEVAVSGPAPAQAELPAANIVPQWSFTTARDERAYGLTAEQCETAFPGIFIDIDRAVKYRKKIGNITPEDVDISWKDDAAVRAVIIDQQLYVIEAKFSGSGYASVRGLGILHAIHRAIITSPTPIPNVEFSFTTSDIADPTHLQHSIWALSRTEGEEEKWLMSDFGYWSWPNYLIGGYEQVRREIANTEVDFAAKKKQIVWRGALKTNAHRKDLLRATADKEWADVQAMGWTNSTSVTDQDMSKALPIPEHCQYQFVVQTEVCKAAKISAPESKLRNRTVRVVTRLTHRPQLLRPRKIPPKLQLCRPSQNIVEVETDFSDQEEKVLSLLQNPEKAQRIARNNVETFRDRYLTPAAQACYWRRMLRSWADVSFKPREWDMEEGTEARRTRGMPFESFVNPQERAMYLVVADPPQMLKQT
ncbi:uncharacterized protein BP5553_09898 [Venustampulla echinocandica]|uniref:Glycosyl transferase CAP10 domain-containing protein n=1 Tax=Venustampulla echinocandica TaxID=2656787 RepID=A0A370TB09_9HELO|nr:uncharacterized protein BP5553_09898 [Venustampulla echinocandica]RDL31109.1 hypothetical protein BP5553_09898 [Venustampulla echinocandica]